MKICPKCGREFNDYGIGWEECSKCALSDALAKEGSLLLGMLEEAEKGVEDWEEKGMEAL